MPRIKDLTTKTGNLSSADQFVSDNGTSVTKIDYTALARAIIEQYNGSTLAGSAQSVQAALNSLNSNFITITGSGGYQSEATKAALQATYNALPNNCYRTGIILAGDVGSISILKANNNYGTLVRVGYGFANTSAVITTMNIYNGEWGNWVPQPTRAEMNAATAATTITQLRNTDLNTLTEPMRIYYAGGSHGCTNVPANASSFGLIVLQISSGYRAQICISSGLNVYIRRYDSNTWGTWFEFAKSAIS